ncbi:anti-Muellerian hormone type-2 receptor-like [Centropristis striata]|uniref:anti-Muellerian hormone type-2 receptor-like n=1 Tax=Centropristis striata TaxID=184440 RepID=UPI0027E11C4A|nr:anti-Muellerian hormone type-2 receptor-like [Centropristis striata]XP_059184455.1 anti-Muellerian hormone type-2 receptor-like [Centropristis striata]
MILQQWWQIFAVGCIFICTSSQSVPQKRLCAFQVTPKNNRYRTAGNVSGSVQLCENTQCCVGFFLMIDGQPEVDVLACDMVDKSCPHATCKAQTRLNGRFMKCLCNTDLCNSNITWSPESEEPRPTYSNPVDNIGKAAGIILTGTFVVLCFLLIAVARWRRIIQMKKKNPPSLDDFGGSLLCSCQTTKTSEIDISNIELQQIVGYGHFATVWQGKCQGSLVAVKDFPAGRKHQFTAEKEVYELPLMEHDGIVHFLGTGKKLDGDSCLIVLQYAECGSLHSYLCKHTTNWMLSLKLCQSLSQGLSYLHSDLHRHDLHKPPVAHRDLSSSNVLVKADGTCVLCDFGCSTILRSCSGHRRWQSQARNMEGHARLGTLRYMSPEILEGSVNLSSSWCLMQGDVYALGLLLWEIWIRCSDLCEGGIAPQHLLPYESELGANVTLESLVQFVFHLDMRPSVPKHWELLPQGFVLQELLADCWDCDPDARLTAQCVVDRLVCIQSCHSP